MMDQALTSSVEGGSRQLAGITSPDSQNSTLSPTESLARITRLAKIISTIGPASSSEAEIAELIRAGTNVFRLNFSHGTYETHAEAATRIRKVSKELGVPVGIMQDLCGPKLRLSDFPNGEITLNPGTLVLLKHASSAKSNDTTLTTEAFHPQQVLKEGSKFFLSDGKFELLVTAVQADGVRAEVIRGGVVRSRAGIAMPDAGVSLPAITEKDLRDLDWGLKNGVDFVVLSFVRSADEVEQLREEMRERGKVLPIVAKIERKVALQNLDQIAKASDALMVGRGDLGTEIPIEHVPSAQRKIIEAGLRHGVPVTVATHMLLSMQNSENPTRAEVNDVARAVSDGADSVMLSEETAIGKFPSEAVGIMARAATAGDEDFDYESHEQIIPGREKFECKDEEVIALSAAAATLGSGIHAVILASDSIDAPRLIAKHRARVPVYSCSTDWTKLQGVALFRGIHPLPYPQADLNEDSAGIKQFAFEQAASNYFALNPEARDFGAIILNGSKPLAGSPLSSLEIRRIAKEDWAKSLN